MFRKTTLTGLALAGLTAAAFAHTGATGVVKERMDAMKAMQEALKTIKPMMTGEQPYDAGTVRRAAREIATHAGDALTRHYPEGSTDHPSEALPAIWTRWDRFETLARQLETTALGLAIAADNGLHGAGHMMGSGSSMMGSGTGHMMGDGSGMMGGSMMGGAAPAQMMTTDHIGQMPADGAFTMMTQTCSACHDQFRKDD